MNFKPTMTSAQALREMLRRGDNMDSRTRQAVNHLLKVGIIQSSEETPPGLRITLILPGAKTAESDTV